MKHLFYLDGHDHVALCDLLKLTGLCESGGQAKQWIAQGEVRRNGAVETRKTAKITAGETVDAGGDTIEIRAGSR